MSQVKNKFTMTDPVSHHGKTNTWLTPLNIIQSLGEFDLDPCGFEGHPTARTLFVLPTDGLKEKWFGRVWLNPPYGRYAHDWLKKLEEHGDGIALIFGRTDTKWLQDIMQRNPIYFIKGRVSFLNSEGQVKSNAGAPSVLIPFGDNNVDAVVKSDIEGVLKI